MRILGIDCSCCTNFLKYTGSPSELWSRIAAVVKRALAWLKKSISPSEPPAKPTFTPAPPVPAAVVPKVPPTEEGERDPPPNTAPVDPPREKPPAEEDASGAAIAGSSAPPSREEERPPAEATSNAVGLGTSPEPSPTAATEPLHPEEDLPSEARDGACAGQETPSSTASGAAVEPEPLPEGASPAAAPPRQILEATPYQEEGLNFTIKNLAKGSLMAIGPKALYSMHSYRSEAPGRGFGLDALHPLRFLSMILMDQTLVSLLPGICNSEDKAGTEFRNGLFQSLEVYAKEDKLFIDEFTVIIGRTDLADGLKGAAQKAKAAAEREAAANERGFWAGRSDVARAKEEKIGHWKQFLKILVPTYKLV